MTFFVTEDEMILSQAAMDDWSATPDWSLDGLPDDTLYGGIDNDLVDWDRSGSDLPQYDPDAPDRLAQEFLTDEPYSMSFA